MSQYVCKHGAVKNPEPTNKRASSTVTPSPRRGRIPPVQELTPIVPEVPKEEPAPLSPQEKRKRGALRRSAPFFTTLALVTVIAWMLPLRPTVAEEEKRALASPPVFSVQALADGTYFQETETWFSDTFTGRSLWVKLGQKLKTLYGTSGVILYNAGTTQKDEIPTTPEPGAEAGEEAAEASAGAEQETELPAAEETAQPSPTPTGWGGDSVGENESLNTVGDLIQIGDTCYEWPGFIREYGDDYCALMNKAAEKLEGKAHVYSIIAPFGASVMLSRDFRENTLDCTIEEDALTYLEGQMTHPNLTPVRVIDTLIEHNSEYIFFRTDHHWTGLGAYYAYTAWAEAAGKTPISISDCTATSMGDYLGSYYDAADQKGLLEANPDDMIAYEPPGDLQLFVTDYSEDTPEYYGEEMPVIYDESDAEPGYKYAAYLLGDHSFCALVNNSISDTSACLVYKNSMGNPFVYFLTQHYHTVYVCDYRYYETRTMPEFVDAFGISDVIFVNNTAQAEWDGANELVAGQIGE